MTFSEIFSGVERLTFGSKFVARKQSVGGVSREDSRENPITQHTGDDAIKKGVSKSIVLFISMICHLD